MITVPFLVKELRPGATILGEDGQAWVFGKMVRRDYGLLGGQFTLHPSHGEDEPMVLADFQTVTCLWPSGGDLVRLTGRWDMMHAGDVGMLGGWCDLFMRDANPCFHYHAYRNHKEAYARPPEYVSCSGGPAPTWGIPLVNFRWTGESDTGFFWRWNKHGTGAGNGEDYTLQVPVWEWDGKA